MKYSKMLFCRPCRPTPSESTPYIVQRNVACEMGQDYIQSLKPISLTPITSITCALLFSKHALENGDRSR